MNQFWSPFDGISGVDQSPLTLEETKKRFPNLPEPAIVKALEFFHLQIFNQPLAQPPPDDECAEALRMLEEHDPGAVSGEYGIRDGVQIRECHLNAQMAQTSLKSQ